MWNTSVQTVCRHGIYIILKKLVQIPYYVQLHIAMCTVQSSFIGYSVPW